MRLVMLFFVLFAVSAPWAAAQTLCGPPPGANGGLLDAGRGQPKLDTRIAGTIRAHAPSDAGATLEVGLFGDGCRTATSATAVEPDETPILGASRLESIAPNPFNPRAEIRFELARRGAIRLEIFDAAGRRVRTLADAVLDAGAHRRVLDGAGLASGVYRVRLRTDQGATSRSVVLLK